MDQAMIKQISKVSSISQETSSRRVVGLSKLCLFNVSFAVHTSCYNTCSCSTPKEALSAKAISVIPCTLQQSNIAIENLACSWFVYIHICIYKEIPSVFIALLVYSRVYISNICIDCLQCSWHPWRPSTHPIGSRWLIRSGQQEANVGSQGRLSARFSKMRSCSCDTSLDNPVYIGTFQMQKQVQHLQRSEKYDLCTYESSIYQRNMHWIMRVAVELY